MFHSEPKRKKQKSKKGQGCGPSSLARLHPSMHCGVGRGPPQRHSSADGELRGQPVALWTVPLTTLALQRALLSHPKAQQGRAAKPRGVGFTWVSLWFVDKVITWIGGRGHVLPLPGQHGVVLLPVIVGVEELLEPLDEFKVVLEFSFDELFYWNYLERGKQNDLCESPGVRLRFLTAEYEGPCWENPKKINKITRIKSWYCENKVEEAWE